ncbi:hypothetical protein [Candidatus Phycosocius bacilliformis]
MPITHAGNFARRLGFAVPIPGVQTTWIIKCNQPRVLDIAARAGRKVE